MPREMLKRWLSRRPRLIVGTAAVPAGVRVYAIGDIHGRVDLLQQLHQRIAADAAHVPPDQRLLVVYLGDYVDRGLHSREVVDLLLDGSIPGFEAVHLRGNHDHELVAFLEDPVRGAGWLRYGGDATLYSYGVRASPELPPEARLIALRDRLLEMLPRRHLAFFTELPYSFEIGDYFFVHAGVHPDRPLDRQTPSDLLWIRDEFLEADVDFGKVVVHGHSVTEHPEVRENRIGVDTGACYTNALTCLVLQGNTYRFLSTRDLRPV